MATTDQDASFERDKARLLHSGAVRSARSSLLWVAGLLAVGQCFDFARSGGAAVAALVVGLGVAGLFGGLWRWSERNTLGATSTGLAVFATLRVAELITHPASILQGLVFKVVVLVLLIRGVRAGLALRRQGVESL